MPSSNDKLSVNKGGRVSHILVPVVIFTVINCHNIKRVNIKKSGIYKNDVLFFTFLHVSRQGVMRKNEPSSRRAKHFSA
jgi:hypothetical protein